MCAMPGFGGVSVTSDWAALCNLIDETLINNLFMGYVEGTGTAVKQYVCGGR